MLTPFSPHFASGSFLDWKGLLPTDPRAQAIASAAQRLVELGDRWLNPPEWVEWIEEPVPDYPQSSVPRDNTAATALKKRTLTNLYNRRPQWLVDAHAQLDAAVAAACGWPADITNDAVLNELIARNRLDGIPAGKSTAP